MKELEGAVSAAPQQEETTMKSATLEDAIASLDKSQNHDLSDIGKANENFSTKEIVDELHRQGWATEGFYWEGDLYNLRVPIAPYVHGEEPARKKEGDRIVGLTHYQPA